MLTDKQLKQWALVTLLSNADCLRRLAEVFKQSRIHNTLMSVHYTLINVCKGISSMEVFNVPGMSQLLIATRDIVNDCVVATSFAHWANL